MHVENSVLKRFSELVAAHTPECSVQYSVYAGIYKYLQIPPGLKEKTKVLHGNFTVGGVSKNLSIRKLLFWEKSAWGAVCLGGSYAVAAVMTQRQEMAVGWGPGNSP